MSERCDVAVVGAGAIGTALALALAGRGFEVALVEPRAPPAFDAGSAHDLRTYAISPASTALLQRLGAWSGVCERRVSPYARMRVWEDDLSRGLHFDATLIAEAELGHIVEDSVLRDALWQKASDAPHLAILRTRCSALEVVGSHARLALEDGSALRARLVVAADGAESPLRVLAGLDAEGAPATLAALIANVRTQHAHQATAWQRFTDDGPLAFLPLSNGESSVVWSVPMARALALRDGNEEAFRRELAEAFQHTLGAIDASSARVSIPVRTQLAPRYAAARVALVGDAAHAVLPLAGQGLNLGLLDAAALVDVLSDAAQAREDIGELDVLRRYERWRRSDNAMAARSFAALDRLFREQSPGVPWLRRSGMALVDRVAPLKREFALQASGFAGRVASLSRRLG